MTETASAEYFREARKKIEAIPEEERLRRGREGLKEYVRRRKRLS